MESNGAPKYSKMHNFDLCQKTQHPNVELDISETSCELQIPYITPSSYYDLDDERYDWGTYYLDVLSALKVGSGSPLDVEYSVFMSFKDLELSAPVFIPESGHPGKGTGTGVQTTVRRRKPRPTTTLSDEEKVATHEGFLSKSLARVSDIAGTLAYIPGWGALASGVSMAAAGGSSMCAYFGWSKPLNITALGYYLQHPFHQSHNVSGTSTASVLALSPTAKMEMLPEFSGAEVDEMSFAYLKQIPAIVDAFTVFSTAVPDTVLYTKNIAMDTLVLQTNPSPGVFFRSMPPFVYIAQMFQMTRGSINVTLKFVKTDFHSSRLLVTWTPHTSADTPNNFESSYSLREIIDVRTMKEVTLNLPYLRAYNYLDGARDVNGQINSFGKFQISVLNELRAPETCSQEYDVLIYYSGGSDFEVAGYQGVQGFVPMVPEMGDMPLGNAPPVSSGLDHNIGSAGDPFTSVKQLLNISTPLRFDSAAATAIATGTWNLYPFTCQLWEALWSGSPLLLQPELGDDLFSYIAPGYAFMRGGMRISVIPDNTDGFTATRLGQAEASVSSFAVGAMSSADFGVGGVKDLKAKRTQMTAYRPNISGQSDSVMPHMGKTPLRLVRPQTAGANPYTPAVDESRYRLEVHSMGAARPAAITRAAHDDFALGYFIGFPLLMNAFPGF
jgi:hypothetical protein